jgi:hypothetical protein
VVLPNMGRLADYVGFADYLKAGRLRLPPSAGPEAETTSRTRPTFAP